ncbi:MAG TPA: hypothetical protein VF043_33540, partial [Ktedonobacteraceae bacterium]
SGEPLLRRRREWQMGREGKLHVYVLLLSGKQCYLQFTSKATLLFSNQEAKAEVVRKVGK